MTPTMWFLLSMAAFLYLIIGFLLSGFYDGQSAEKMSLPVKFAMMLITVPLWLPILIFGWPYLWGQMLAKSGEKKQENPHAP